MCKKLLYGDDIQWAMQRDAMLRKAESTNGLKLEIDDYHNMTNAEKRMYDEAEYLVKSGYMYWSVDGGYFITEEGREFLHMGGYTSEVAKSKNDIYAFHLSVAAIIISAVSLLVSLLDHL